MSGLLAFNLTICLYWQIPQDCDFVFGAHARTISRVCLYIHLFAEVPAGVFVGFVVSVGIQFWPAQGTLPQYGQ